MDAVRASVRGCEHVYHLAAATSWCKPAKREYSTVNVQGTANVARAALEAGVGRLVYASTVGVYGHCSGRVDESTPPHPDSAYRQSKLQGERVALSWAARGLPVVIARLSTIYGPGSFRWLGFARALVAGRARLVGSGENHVHDVYISDAVEGLRRCAEGRTVVGGCYLVAGEAPIILKRLVELLANELGVSPLPARLPAAPFMVLHHACAAAYRRLGIGLPFSRKLDLFLDDRVFSISKAQNEVGYAPATSIHVGLRNTIGWYRVQGYL
jgi:nucleoside-diphosphate-sugar epimerase